MTNLVAICRPGGEFLLKRVQLVQGLQERIGGVFQQQANSFMEGVDEEVPFGSDWNPDANEILTLVAPEEVVALTAALQGDILALPNLSADNIMGEAITGLAVATANGGVRIYVQSFTAQQVLRTARIALMLDGNTFRELSEPAFTLASQLSAIVEGGQLKFKSFHKVKRIFTLNALYQEATDHEIGTFCTHPSLFVPDVAAVRSISDQICRTLIHAVSAAGILDQYTVDDISAKAATIGLPLSLNQGLIALPTSRKALKELLRFLDDGIYAAPISEQRYVTNSKRRVGAFAT